MPALSSDYCPLQASLRRRAQRNERLDRQTKQGHAVAWMAGLRMRGIMGKQKERADKAEDECEALRRKIEQLEEVWKLHEQLQTQFDEQQTQLDHVQHEHERVLTLLDEIRQVLGDIPGVFGKYHSDKSLRFGDHD